MRIGMDVGSTTLKCVAIDDNNNIVFKAYERHYSKIADKSSEMLSQILKQNPEFKKSSITVFLKLSSSIQIYSFAKLKIGVVL